LQLGARKAVPTTILERNFIGHRRDVGKKGGPMTVRSGRKQREGEEETRK